MLISVLAGAMVLGDVAFASEVEVARLPIKVATGGAVDETVVVEAGDHLWKISAKHLQAVSDRPPTNTEIAPYWREVIALNTPLLRSGDPDLIYPGELVTLP